jgi:hypothetical protein
MNSLRGWAVAFLTYVATDHGRDGHWLAPTIVAMTMGLVGTGASVAGNEASIRVGRQRLVRLAMMSCAVCAAGIGFLATRSYPLAAVLVLVYGLLIWLDSSSLTAGAAGQRRSEPARRHPRAPFDGGLRGRVRRAHHGRVDP